MENDNKFSYFFLGLGIGVAAGILFAPKAGAETRELLIEKADEGKEFLKKTTDDLKESAASLVDRGKQTIAKQKEQLVAAVEAGKSAYREKVSPGAASSPEVGDELVEGV